MDGKIFNYLGVSTWMYCFWNGRCRSKKNYDCITYGTNNELGFDYLRDNMKYEIKEMVQRGFNFCIVDEVDSILIDESRTPLVISEELKIKALFINYLIILLINYKRMIMSLMKKIKM